MLSNGVENKLGTGRFNETKRMVLIHRVHDPVLYVNDEMALVREACHL